MDLMSIAFAIVALIVGVIIGYLIKQAQQKREIADAKNNADVIVDDAIKQAQTLKREALFEAKEENIKYRNEVEAELKERRSEVSRSENRLIQREETLDQRTSLLDQREANLDKKETDLNERQEKIVENEEKVSSLLAQHEEELERISMLSQDEARQIVLDTTEQTLTNETARMIQDAYQNAQAEADKNAKHIIIQAMQRTASNVVTETSVSVVNLPNDDMKGRIIGREGRNIKTFESLTGIDLIIDDTPETVVLSGFDPIRREIARIALEKLIQDGRIHPARIEEMVERARREVDDSIREKGEEAVFDIGIHNLHPDLIKMAGRMAYRTSYGQNVLEHSIEVAKLAGYMASQLGEDVALAKRAGFLHDIGKALDNEVEGTHVEIGAEIAKRYNEDPVVVNAIAAHHGDTQPASVIAVLVIVADTLSAARPGARSESLENYVRRLEQLEEIANSYDGVSHSFAIQAGREIRVIVKPDEINDAQAVHLSRDIKNEIENTMTYPGNVKVTVIRETRAIEYAK